MLKSNTPAFNPYLAVLLAVVAAAFLSIGAYASALMTIHWHTPSILNMLAGGIVAALFGVFLG